MTNGPRREPGAVQSRKLFLSRRGTFNMNAINLVVGLRTVKAALYLRSAACLSVGKI